jgi:hypothetical protein
MKIIFVSYLQIVKSIIVFVDRRRLSNSYSFFKSNLLPQCLPIAMLGKESPRPIQLSVKWPPGIFLQGRAAHSLPPGAEVKNSWSLPPRLHISLWNYA